MGHELRALGTSGLKTPKLVLGGNVFGWTAAAAAGFDILDRFIEAGGKMIDSADVYSAWIPGHKGGESETYIGEWLARGAKRSDVLIATKVGMLPGPAGEGLKPERIAEAVEASLNRLQTDYIDLYYAHRDDPDVPLDEVLGAFGELVASGKVRAIGASNYTAARLEEALSVSARLSLPAYSVLQPELNLIAREGFPEEMRRLCEAENIGVLTYFALASGFLTGKYRTEADLSKSLRGGRMKPLLEGHGQAMLAAMDKIAAETGASLAQIALAWVMAQPGVTAPIASATTAAQLDELLGALSLDLSAEQLAALDAVTA